MKNVLYPELVLVLWAARTLGRQVMWIREPRQELAQPPRMAATASSGPAWRSIATAAFWRSAQRSPRQSGRLCLDGGAGRADHGDGERDGWRLRHPADRVSTRGVFTNTTPIDAYRGAGKPEANYLIERCIDIAAVELGMDALKLRRKNIFRRFPHPSAMGLFGRAGQLAHAIDHAVAAAAGFEARRKSSRKRGRLRGLGYACFLKTARGQPNEVAEVRLGEDGLIDLMVGTHSNGQGHETTYAQIAADALGLPLERFLFRQGDTDDLNFWRRPWRRALHAPGWHRAADGRRRLDRECAAAGRRGCWPVSMRLATKPACCA